MQTGKQKRLNPRSKEFNMTPSQNKVLISDPRLETLKENLSFILHNNAPRKQYSRTKAWEKKKDIIHWGQRKLFLSELWFLTKYGHLATCVVYAGSAPGTHIPFLAQLFPKHKFILIDPSNFDLKDLQDDKTNVKERITVRQEYFTDEIATQLAQEHQGNILFVSDIRTADPHEQDAELVEIMVYRDNMKQKDWINIMKPKKSLLKFRCPYPDRQNGKENLRMFKGEIYIQPYAAPTSTETRLVPDDSLEEIEYDNVKYEEQLFYHNHVTRRATYQQPIEGGEGFNQTWDLSAEIVILYDFITKFPEHYANLPIFERIKKISYELSRNITQTSRTLATPMVAPERRRHFNHKDHTSFYPDLRQELTEVELRQLQRENQE